MDETGILIVAFGGVSYHWRMRVQFLLKKNECYSFVSYTRRSSGLWNSTRFIVESLIAQGVDAEIIEVDDNNDIDREVTRYKPDIVVIEALWVVPSKFDVLKALHPNIKWHVHLHSNMPFLAIEGISIEWILGYASKGVGLIANSWESFTALRAILSQDQVIYLPNVYIASFTPWAQDKRKDTLDIACFGAIRPLKNQLLQAMAAIEFCHKKRRKLRFHMNGSRVETGGEPILKCIQSLFLGQTNKELVLHPWMEPAQFQAVLAGMDIGMQVSLTETFNVVTANYLDASIPIVVSNEVKWVCEDSKADEDDIEDIVDKMEKAYSALRLISKNQARLTQYSQKAQSMWYDFAIGDI